MRISKEPSGMSKTTKKKRTIKVKKVIFEGNGSLDTLFIGFGRDSSCSVLLIWQGNRSETKKEPSRTFKTAQKQPERPKMLVFKGDGSFDTLCSWF